MKKCLKIIFIILFCSIIPIFFVSSLYAEYCFEVPENDIHEDSKKANELVFNIGVKIYESFEKIEQGKIESANNKLDSIRKISKELESVYHLVEEKSKYIKIDMAIFHGEGMAKIISLIKRRNYKVPESPQELVSLGLKEIISFKELMKPKNIKYVESRSRNLEIIRKLIDNYYDLTNIGFVISDSAYKTIGR